MGIVYGRMNSGASRTAHGDHTNSSPSKAKRPVPTGRSANRRRSDDSDDASDNLPARPITRQASRIMAQQRLVNVRRSPRLNPRRSANRRRSDGSNNGSNNLSNRRITRQVSRIVAQQRRVNVRRSARLN